MRHEHDDLGSLAKFYMGPRAFWKSSQIFMGFTFIFALADMGRREYHTYWYIHIEHRYFYLLILIMNYILSFFSCIFGLLLVQYVLRVSCSTIFPSSIISFRVSTVFDIILLTSSNYSLIMEVKNVM